MNQILYWLFRFFIGFLGILPVRLVYIFSDFLAFLLFYVVKYRKKVVFNNLRNSFPEKNETEISKIAKKFYQHLCDIMVETFKAFSFSDAEMIKRYKVSNQEILTPYFAKNQNIILSAGHYGNWEWATQSVGFQTDFQLITLYKPLSNSLIDKYLREQRRSRKVEVVSISETRKVFSDSYEKPAGFVMAADQSPSNLKRAFWVKFLNQDTACLHGVESYAKLYNLPVFFCNIQREKRGFYTVTLSLLVENPQDTTDGEISQIYLSALEKIILEKPENYLWSHRRWKHKRN